MVSTHYLVLAAAALMLATSPGFSQTSGPAVATATVSLDQVNLPIADLTDPTELKQKVESFRNAMQMIKSCDDVPGVAKDVGAEITLNRSVPLTALPSKLRDMVASMPIGTATPLFGEPGKYVRSIVLCGRGPT